MQAFSRQYEDADRNANERDESLVEKIDWHVILLDSWTWGKKSEA